MDNYYNQAPEFQPPFNPEPQYYQRQVSFGEAITRALTVNYCNFSGRASRSEYWWFALFSFLVGLPFTIAQYAYFFATNGESSLIITILSWIVSLALFLPSLGLSIRRLHDINKSGWWYLLGIVLCCVGGLILIYFYCQDSDPTDNEYGPVPNLEPVN